MAAGAGRVRERASLRQISTGLLASFHAHRWLIAVVVVYAAAGVVTAVAFGIPAMRSPLVYIRLFDGNAALLGKTGLGVASIMAAAYVAYVALVRRPDRLFQHFRDRLRSLAVAERLIIAAPVLLIFPLFVSTVTIFKATILRLNFFDWDVTLANFDRTLHGGHDLWYWLQPIFGHPLLTRGLDLVYALWFVVFYAMFFGLIFSTRDPRFRMQFLWTLMLSWIVLGSIAATAFSSAGPCYFGRITGLPDPYGPLMHYLHRVAREHPLIALRAQAFLWAGYTKRAIVPFDGISAMPSMHVSMATLFALVGWRVSRRLGIAMTSFVLLILIGSVELAWHYAIDGYAAIVGTMAIWWAVGWMQRREPAVRAALSASSTSARMNK